MTTSPSRGPFARLLTAVWDVHDAAAEAIRGPIHNAAVLGVDVHSDQHELRTLRDTIADAQDAFEHLDASGV
jgi:hypothetical protein